MKYFIKILPFVVIVISIIPALLPLLAPGFFVMHDDEQIGRLFDLHASLASFHIPPRIVPNLGFGYGYPFFNFYPPFVYYIGEAFHLLGFGYIVSTKLMLVTIFLSSAYFMYLFSKQFFGRIAGLVSSIAYTYASYRAVDVYARGAFAEAASFPFIPLLFWATYKTYQTNKWIYVVISSLSLGALILSHNLIAIMTLPFWLAWVCYLFYISKSKKIFVKNTLLAFLIGFGLTAYFWLPSYFEREYTLINILTSELANYSLHFVCTYQLWDSPWGYGGSIQGCFDGISFEVGKVQLLASLVSFLLAVTWIIRGRKQSKLFPIILFFFFLAGCMFLMVKFSKPIWDILKPLWYIQFPWRFLLISSFVSAFLTGACVSFISNRYVKVVLSLVIAGGIIYLSVGKFSPERYINVDDNFYVNKEKIRWETSSLAYEYVPKGIQTKKSDIGTTKIDIEKFEIASRAAEVISGEMSIRLESDTPQFKKFVVDVVEPGVMQINTFSFPGWQVIVNGEKVTYTDNNKLKLIRIDLPVGEHIVEAHFTDTKVRLVGNIITGISIILVGIISFLKLYKHSK